MSVVRISIGYIAISILIATIFLLSSKLYYFIKRKAGIGWVENTYILSFISLLIVLILKTIYNNGFSFVGKKPILSEYIILQIFIAAFFAAVLSYLAKPEGRNSTLRVEILTGMAMEIPMRALVQNLFVLFGATAVLFQSINLAIILTAIIWVQFIIIQEIMMKRSLSSNIILESISSIWFSIWVGVIYVTTDSIIVVMITHGLERWFAYMIRKKGANKVNLENKSC